MRRGQAPFDPDQFDVRPAIGHRDCYLIAFLDYNRCQVDGYVPEICEIAPVAEKWRSFGWQVQQIDGHDLYQILAALEIAHRSEGRSHMIIANTIKGKGVSYMENRLEWHSRGIVEEEYGIALRELESAGRSLAEEGVI
jgi:transketolase